MRKKEKPCLNHDRDQVLLELVKIIENLNLMTTGKSLTKGMRTTSSTSVYGASPQPPTTLREKLHSMFHEKKKKCVYFISFYRQS